MHYKFIIIKKLLHIKFDDKGKDLNVESKKIFGVDMINHHDMSSVVAVSTYDKKRFKC